MLWIVLGIVSLILLGTVAAVLLLVGGSAQSVTAPSAPSAPTKSTATTATEPTASAQPSAPPIAILSQFAPLLADVNADGHDDLVTEIALRGSGPATQHYVAFDGLTGRELSRSAAIADDRTDTLPVVVGRRLITATHAGQLTSYGLANGSQQWTTALGARVIAFCAAKSVDSLLVSTDEQRQLAIDLTTGRQSETKEPCSLVLARSDRSGDPRDRHDYSAPRGVESYHCGGVTVMGDANYTVPDQCLARAHVDTDHLDGLIGHRLWKVEQNWLVFGVRKPGAYVPMVGLIKGGRVAWKAEVPQDNPLEAQEGSPQGIALAGSNVIATYATDKSRRLFVTAFALADGTRRWTTPLPDQVTSLSSLTSSAERVFVLANEQLFLLDAGSGKIAGNARSEPLISVRGALLATFRAEGNTIRRSRPGCHLPRHHRRPGRFDRWGRPRA